VEYIIEKGEELSSNWHDLVREFDYPMPDGFYYFEKDEKTGLNTEVPSERKGRPLDAPVDFVYRLSRVVHRLIFEPGKNFFGLMKAIAKGVEGKGMEKCYHWVEHMVRF
jgi:methylenetetrahydrofolate reductase (NADPH)